MYAPQKIRGAVAGARSAGLAGKLNGWGTCECCSKTGAKLCIKKKGLHLYFRGYGNGYIEAEVEVAA